MPSLKVAAVARMNSCSSMLSSRWNARIGGIVDSPTPTVPISSDSTSVTSTIPRNCWDSAAAAIQPAVPPPAITTLFISMFMSAIEPTEQHGPDLPRPRLVDGAEHPARLLRETFAGASRRTEDVVLDDVLPGGLLTLRPVPQRPDQLVQRVHRRRNELRRGAPPVVHERIERTQSLHVMPPHGGDEHGITRFHFAH